MGRAGQTYTIARHGLNFTFAVPGVHVRAMTRSCLRGMVTLRMMDARRRSPLVVLHVALLARSSLVVRMLASAAVHFVERFDTKAFTMSHARRHRLARAHAPLAAHAVTVRFLHWRVLSFNACLAEGGRYRLRPRMTCRFHLCDVTADVAFACE